VSDTVVLARAGVTIISTAGRVAMWSTCQMSISWRKSSMGNWSLANATEVVRIVSRTP